MIPGKVVFGVECALTVFFGTFPVDEFSVSSLFSGIHHVSVARYLTSR